MSFRSSARIRVEKHRNQTIIPHFRHSLLINPRRVARMQTHFKAVHVRRERRTTLWENGRTCQSRDPTHHTSASSSISSASLSLSLSISRSFPFFSLKLKNRVRLEVHRVRRACRREPFLSHFRRLRGTPLQRENCTRG